MTRRMRAIKVERKSISTAEELRLMQKAALLEFQQEVDECSNERRLHEKIKQLKINYIRERNTLIAEEKEDRLFFELTEPTQSPLYEQKRRTEAQKRLYSDTMGLLEWERLTRSSVETDEMLARIKRF